MAKLIPSLNACLSNNMTIGEEHVAKVLMHHLKDDSWIWYNPSIPPENLEPDFIILDPGRGLLILEVKDWKLETIQQATSNSVTLLNCDGVSETKNPFKQVKSYGYAVSQRLQKMPNLVHSQEGSLQGKLILPYPVAVVFTNITRSELETRDLVEIFGTRSVFCKDDIVKNIDSETFRDRLWSPRVFPLQSRLTDKQVNSICHVLCLEKPSLEPVQDFGKQSNFSELTEKSITPIKSLQTQHYQPTSKPDNQANQSEPNYLPERDTSQTSSLETQPSQLLPELNDQGDQNKDVIRTSSSQSPFSQLLSEQASQDSQSETNNLLEENRQTESLRAVFQTPNDKEISPALISAPISRLTVPPSPPSRFSLVPVWMKVGSAVLALSVLALGIKSAPYFQKPKLQASSLTIGTLGSPEYQADLADYLREQLVPADFGQFLLGKRVRIVIDGDKTLPYQEAENRIAAKEWDIAFTLSPVISVAAKDNDYTFVAQMFPGNGRYQSALFVRADSPIKSTDDLKPSTVIALGNFNSASSFYMPAYDLFGKTLAADMGHRGSEILEMVKTGKADVGAAAVGDTVKADDPSIRIIHLSRDLPGSGVYLSPNLSTSDRQTIAKALLSVPQEIQKKANYGAGKEADYSFFREIISKAESIQICSDFTKNSVNFFCPDSYKPVTLAGKVNGWSHKSNTHVLNVREQSGKTYRVAVPPQLLAEATGNSDPLAIQGKEIQVKTSMTPQRLADGSFELELTQARQLNLLSSARTADLK